MTTETQSNREKTQEAILTLVSGWEQSCAYDFIDDLLNDLSDEQIAKVAEQQGVDLT